MRYLSLFTGIGGFELGINQAYELLYNAIGSEAKTNAHASQDMPDNTGDVLQERRQRPVCIGYSEIDKYACQIYSRHFPNHKNYGDITKIIESELPAFDLLVGGFPCQSFSIAGKRGGFNDTRGTLFFDIARIIKEKQPRLLLLENVKGLLSHDEGKTFYTIISALDELGYDLQWQVLNSKNHGVPQNRERIFIIGHLRGTPRPEVFPFIGECSEAQSVDQVGKINDGQSGRIYGVDGVSPTLNTMEKGGLKQPKILVPEATKKGYAEAHPGQSINLSVMGSKTRRGRVSDIAQTLDTGMQQHTLTSDIRIRRLTPIECERLQGFPDDWTKTGIEKCDSPNSCPPPTRAMCQGHEIEISDTQRYKCLGNAVTVNVIRDIVISLL